ncbi:MAG: type II toxin-antitoxin system RelE/ParE family toxin [Deltaproteobacteria bacterium]|nr:type II toxin-antitoxin system RelE/ParE family toxin [Deltaproteobacteria bacterium]
MKVHWTDTAEGHLDAIYAYIALDSPQYAKRVIDRLTTRSQQIADFPLSGRGVPEYIEAAMGYAKYEILKDDGTYYGEIKECPGVYSNATTPEKCRNKLEEGLEE